MKNEKVVKLMAAMDISVQLTRIADALDKMAGIENKPESEEVDIDNLPDDMPKELKDLLRNSGGDVGVMRVGVPSNMDIDFDKLGDELMKAIIASTAKSDESDS